MPWRIGVAVAVVLSAGAASAATRQPACPPNAKPDWLKIPSPGDFGRYYPERTETPPNVDGHVTLDCIANEAGGLVRCVVTKEDPPELGFGHAALQLSRYFRLKRPGCPAPGHHVIFPIRFTYANDG